MFNVTCVINNGLKQITASAMCKQVHFRIACDIFQMLSWMLHMTAAEFMTCAVRVHHTDAIFPDTQTPGYNPASINYKARRLVKSVTRYINLHKQPYNFHGTVWSRLWLYGNVVECSHVAVTSLISKEVVADPAGLSACAHKKVLSHKQSNT